MMPTATNRQPLRSCRICRQQLPKSHLTRWVRAASGVLEQDTAQRLPGRGYYSCSEQCQDRLMHMAHNLKR